ncbi:MAG: hypothetical protein JNK82_20260 [Myxococcaceae bacterium]|nr:hypothetical protein [Myxococcaceae bacterium]
MTEVQLVVMAVGAGLIVVFELLSRPRNRDRGKHDAVSAATDRIADALDTPERPSNFGDGRWGGE